MSRRTSGPPALVRWLLRLLLPESEREFYLGDLEESGRRSWVREVASEDDDPRRRMYAITAKGRAVLRQEVERLDQLLRHVRPSLAGGRSNRA